MQIAAVLIGLPRPLAGSFTAITRQVDTEPFRPINGSGIHTGALVLF